MSDFSILTVCTGNICRSPAAERLLAQLLGPSVEVTSAGTRAMVGYPVEPAMASLMTAQQVGSEGFQARLLTEAIIDRANLILALTTDHRAYIVEESPAAVRRTFTLLEFAHLVTVLPAPVVEAGSTPGQWLRAWMRVCMLNRAASAAMTTSASVPDPYGRDSAAFELAWQQTRDACYAIARACGIGVAERPPS